MKRESSWITFSSERASSRVSLLARYGNRHGLVAGATGTGKTVSLMVLAEGFSRMGVRSRSPIGGKYDSPMNRESAYEILSRQNAKVNDTMIRSNPVEAGSKSERGGRLSEFLWGTSRRQGMVESMAKQAARTVGSQIGRQILRGLLGGILGGSRR